MQRLLEYGTIKQRDEWVALLKGSAGLLFEGETETQVMGPGDCLLSRVTGVTESNGPIQTRKRFGWHSIMWSEGKQG